MKPADLERPLVIQWTDPRASDGALRAFWARHWEDEGRRVVRVGTGWGAEATDLFAQTPDGEAVSTGIAMAWWFDGSEAFGVPGQDWQSAWGGMESPDPDAPETAWQVWLEEPPAPGTGRVGDIVGALGYGAQSPKSMPAQDGLIGSDPAWCAVADQVQRMAQHELPVLLLGESGSGKEGLARRVHSLGPRAGGAWVPVNCGAIPVGLAESALFGHRKGAFTGAAQAAPGLLLQADGGTLFLDEVHALELTVQAKLLRVLEDGQVTPVGGGDAIPVSVRLVSAAQPDLADRVNDGRFREDLYYRLAYGVIAVPPLRERPVDILPLAQYFLNELQPLEQRVTGWDDQVERCLQDHPWPGNVRELRTVIGRLVMLCPNEKAGIADIQLDVLGRTAKAAEGEADDPLSEGFSIDHHLASIRQRLFTDALERTRYNRSAAARLLGVSPQAVSKFVRSVQDAT